VQGRGNRYNQRLELVVEAIRRVNPDQDRREGFREEDCIPSAPRPIDEMWSELESRIAAVGNPWIRRLLGGMAAAHADRLRIWPAAVTVHHAYRGGLLEHILSLAALADHAGSVYGADRDVLFAGAVLHDIGKLEELAYDGATIYTRDGNLLGHIAIGVTMVERAIARIEGFPPELRSRIVHLVVSHHGARELGSPVEPMTEEAFILSAIDDLDARLHQVRRHVQDGGVDGEFTPYHPRLKRVLLRPGGR
jgi:3'-5' exoribonuclease